MARLRPVSLTQQFDAAIKGTQEQIQQGLVAFARQEHSKVMTAVPIPLAFSQIVDGQLNAPLEKIKWNGFVLFRYPRHDLIARFAVETLKQLSPVGLPSDKRPGHPGLYRDSHTMFINGVQATDFSGWEEGQEIIVASFLPYSRVIERGLMKMRVPGTSMVYQQAESIVKRKYGNLANIRYTFRGFVGGTLATGTAHGKSDNRYPALVISDKTGRR